MQPDKRADSVSQAVHCPIEPLKNLVFSESLHVKLAFVHDVLDEFQGPFEILGIRGLADLLCRVWPAIPGAIDQI